MHILVLNVFFGGGGGGGSTLSSSKRVSISALVRGTVLFSFLISDNIYGAYILNRSTSKITSVVVNLASRPEANDATYKYFSSSRVENYFSPGSILS